jgi:hypothetical protein
MSAHLTTLLTDILLLAMPKLISRCYTLAELTTTAAAVAPSPRLKMP